MMNKVIKYDGQFGKFSANMATRRTIDKIAHRKVWKAAHEDYWILRDVYRDILEQALHESGFDEYEIVKTDWGAKTRIGSDYLEVNSQGVWIF